MPLHPIVSSIGTITYECAHYLVKVVGKTEHIKKSNKFVKEVRHIKLDVDEELCFYNVSTLFTSMPVNKMLEVITAKLEEDNTLTQRTLLAQITSSHLLSLCLNCTCTYFFFHGAYYLQIHCAAIESHLLPIVCNLYIESFKQRALATVPHQPQWWRWYVDDTHMILKKTHSSEFTDHLNSVDDIKWTTEGEVIKETER